MKSSITTQTKSFLTRGLMPALLATAILSLGAGSSVGAAGSPGIAPPNSHAYGMSLTDWLTTYWEWTYTGADPAQSTVGHVKLLPLPVSEYVSGSGTPEDPALLKGKLEITLPPGTPFVLPLFAFVKERYIDGSEDVPLANAVAIGGAHPVLTIDGKTVISEANKAAFYIPSTAFDPIIIYPEVSSINSIAALSFQGIGVVGHPLSVGRHVIHLYEPLLYPSIPAGLIYDNTWIVTVTASR